MLVYVRRIVAILLLVSLLFCYFSLKLLQLQVFKSRELSYGAVSQRSLSFPLEPARGAILDRNRIPLTDPRTEQSVIAFPQFIRDLESTAGMVSEATRGGSGAVNVRSLLDFAISQPHPPVVVLGKATDKDAAQRLSDARMPGIVVAPQTNRYGPRSVARHVVGYVMTADNAGASGIEKKFDARKEYSLRGKRPRSVAPLVTGAQQVIPGLGFHELPASERASVVLSIDARVQRIVESVLATHGVSKGAVVVTDPSSGDILAMASRPDYDQNNVAASIVDTRSPLINRALEPYYPGSVFKVIVAAAALDSKHVNPSLITVCDGLLDVGGGEPIRCSHHKDGAAVVSLQDAMAYSCNPVFVNLARDVGSKAIIEYSKRLGIGSRFVELPEGAPGSIRQPDSLRGLAHLAIGQEYVKATPLEITCIIASIANKGIYMKPRLIRQVLSHDGQVLENYPEPSGQRVMSRETASILSDWLEATVNYGTGSLAAIPQGSAGKTGTPESSQSSWQNERWDAWFVGYGPSSRPKYAIGVFIEDGDSGPYRAAPVFRDILSEVLSLRPLE